MWTVQLDMENGILTAVVMGEFDLAAAQRHFLKLLDDAGRNGATKVLFDGGLVTGSPLEFERFLYGEFVAAATSKVMRERNIRLKFAYVIAQPLRDPNRYGETVAVNRGMDVKT